MGAFCAAAVLTAVTNGANPMPGSPLAGGCVATYQAGTTTPLQTFKDSTGMVANQNPVMLDASGRAPIWINVNAIKYVVKAKSSACSLSSGTILYTTDGVQDQGLRLRTDLAGVNGAGNIGIQQPGGIPSTVHDALALCPDASQYASLAAAIANVPPGGCLNCTSALTGPVTLGAAISIHGQPGCTITSADSAQTVSVTGIGASMDGMTVTNTGAGSALVAKNAKNISLQRSIFTSAVASTVEILTPTGDGSNVTVEDNTITLTGGPANANGTLFVQNSAAAGVSTSVLNNVKIKHNTLYNGGSNFAITVQSAVFGTGPPPIDTVLVDGNFCYKTAHHANAAGCVSLGGYVNNSQVVNNTFDAGGDTATSLQFEDTIGNNHFWGGNISKNVGFSATASNGLVRDAGGGDGLIVQGNKFTADVGVNISPQTYGFSGGPFNITNTVISGNDITAVQNGDVCVAVRTGGNSQTILTAGTLVIGNRCFGTGGGGTAPMLLTYNGSMTGASTVTDTVFVNNTGIGYPYVFGSGTNGAAAPSGTILMGNSAIGAIAECVAACSTLGVLSQSNANLAWLLPKSITAPGHINSGLQPTACVTGTGLDAGGTNCLPGLVGAGNITGAQTVWDGALFFTTVTPAAGSQALFTLTMPAGAFTRTPVCQFFPVLNTDRCTMIHCRGCGRRSRPIRRHRWPWEFPLLWQTRDRSRSPGTARRIDGGRAALIRTRSGHPACCPDARLSRSGVCPVRRREPVF